MQGNKHPSPGNRDENGRETPSPISIPVFFTGNKNGMAANENRCGIYTVIRETYKKRMGHIMKIVENGNLKQNMQYPMILSHIMI